MKQNTLYMREWRKRNRDKVREITNRANKKRNKLQKEWRAENPDKIRQYEKAYAEKYPEKIKEKQDRRKLKKYGLTPDQYSSLLRKQNGVCAICGVVRGMKSLAVDHDHKTGKIRGLLCQFCNTALGKFLDSSEILKKAILYLEKSSGEKDAT